MIGALVRRTFVLALFASSALFARAGLAPENTVVVVNGDSWASLTVANEYVRLRGVPATNVVVLRNLSSIEITDADRFRSEILGPVLDTINARGLKPQIDCITYSVDIPYAVTVNGDKAGKTFPQIITPVASINGLTYLHEWVSKKDTEYLRLDINRYTRRQLPIVSGVALTPDERKQYAGSMALYDAKKYKEAAASMESLLAVKRSDPNIGYNLACCFALAGRPDDAIAALKKAVASGWRNHGQIASDPDLASLASREDFQQLLKVLRTAHVTVQPGMAFRAKYGWDESGQVSPTGPHYMLSTMLGETCGRGNSVSEVLESLRRASAADYTAPKGTIYYPKNGDVRSTTREWGFVPASEEIRHAGVSAIVEDGLLPKNHADVAGAMIGTAQFDWSTSGSTMLPGAIAEHLTSLGGIISERGGQTPCTDLIRAGAAGSSGTVTEPYALQEKFPTPYMHLQYVKGWTLAEAFYQSLYGPYQLLIIGDPMCRPWAKPLKLTLPSVKPGLALKGAVGLKPVASRPASVALYELYVDGKFSTNAKPGFPLKLNTSAMSDGYHELSVVAIELGSVENKTHLSVPITVNNRGRKVVLTGEKARTATFGAKVSLALACKGASSIRVLHLGREVGRIEGAKGEAAIDSTLLGLGKAVLYPVAKVGAESVSGSPITVQVQAPAAIAPDPAPGGTMQPGLELTVAGAAPVVVKDTIDGAWLSRLAPGPSQAFVLTGYFEAPKDDLYQLQIRTNTNAFVEVGAVQVATAMDAKQRLVLIPLRAGTHKLVIHGTAPAGAVMDVRIGAAGALRLAEGQFKHPTRM